VGVLADCDDAGVTDDVAQGLQVVDRGSRIEAGEGGGVLAKPLGELVVTGWECRHTGGSILGAEKRLI
jgi:ABC-type antimicrobial peptide transport system ATPase subunit